MAMDPVEQATERAPLATEDEGKANIQSLKFKTFKDPVYGYIFIEKGITHDIIDTPTFQRLRDIRQTSYAPLYLASLHNRFVYSIGVYHCNDTSEKIFYLFYHPSRVKKRVDVKTFAANLSQEFIKIEEASAF